MARSPESPVIAGICGCHLDRSATEILSHQEIAGAEWRDPEEVSSAMPLQGVLTEI